MFCAQLQAVQTPFGRALATLTRTHSKPCACGC